MDAGLALGSNPRFLVVKLADMGDALTATPALRALRQTWPSASIDLLTTAAGKVALEGLDSLNTIFNIEKRRFDSPSGLLSPLALAEVAALLTRLRRRHYDRLLLLHHLTTPFGAIKYAALVWLAGARLSVGLDNGRGSFLDLRVPDAGFGFRHEAEYNLAVAQAVGAEEPPRTLEMAVDPASAGRAEALLAEGWGMDGSDGGSGQAPPQRTWLAVHAGGGAFSLARRWSPEAFAAAAATLSRRMEMPVALLGSAVDAEANEAVAALLPGRPLNLTGRTSVKEMAAILRRSRLLLSNDSGVVHVASAMGTPVVAVFGPSNAAAWGPFPPERHAVVQVSVPCSPCFYRAKRLGRPQGCATRDCLRLTTPTMVVAAAERLMAAMAA